MNNYEEGYEEEYEDDDEEFEFPEEVDLEQIFVQQMYRTMNITLGAIIAYLNTDVFDELTDDQKDYVFEYVIDSWAMVLPPPLDDMWEKQIQLLALTQQIRNLAEQKRNAQPRSSDTEDRMRVIYSQLGWDYDDVGDSK